MEESMRKQLEKWHQLQEYQKIVDAVEAMPKAARDYEMDGLLARAYNNLDQYGKALQLLIPYAKEGQNDPAWLYRTAYAHYYLHQERQALLLFQKVLELCPGDEDVEEFIQMCKTDLAWPVATPFARRMETFWQVFVREEEKLRQLLTKKETLQQAVLLTQRLLNLGFRHVFFELGMREGKCELSLTPDGARHRLFKLMYWQQTAPKELQEHWNFKVGRQACGPQVGLRVGNIELRSADVQVWAQAQDNQQASLALYCEKLLPYLQDKNPKVVLQAKRALSILLDQRIGELSHIRHITKLEVLTEPRTGESSILLDDVEGWIVESLYQGDWEKAKNFDPCAVFQAYRLAPPAAEQRVVPRADVAVGFTACPEVVQGYYHNDPRLVEEELADGVVYGFLYYKNAPGADRERALLRAGLEQAIAKKCAPFGRAIGGAVGEDCSYIDVVCWDMPTFLKEAAPILFSAGLKEPRFHVYRMDCGAVGINPTQPEK